MVDKSIHIDELVEKVIHKDRIALSKAITLIESSLSYDRSMASSFMQLIQPYRYPIPKIGITGSPGVGKSTFINDYVKGIGRNTKIAILTIDPSSSFTGGSLLGDKTRMSDIVDYDNVFIRPSPSKGKLGGISIHSWETVQICEAAGFDQILIETVGIGQSEIEIKYLADEIVFLVQPGSGDELQGIKKGILEIANKIVVTKTDLDPKLAQTTVHQLKTALHLSDIQAKGNGLSYYQISTKDSASINTLIEDLTKIKPGKLNRFWEFWFQKHINQLCIDFLTNHPKFKTELGRMERQIANGDTSHFRAIELLQNTLNKLC
ncbi:ArgK/MeaB family GTPase [Membranihabitans maritimus]|uniref:ArgK/MeaB family GTPase n=1 Tax=Membranihabitans maritimus TaxID=2904244 RepID=UPI001F00803A|nr:GTPase [Membranihabitans maritimus]